MTQLRWLAVGCLVLGTWLAAVPVAYMDSLGFTVALIALLFGAVYVCHDDEGGRLPCPTGPQGRG